MVLTISLLASNRPDTIERCLDSVKLFMKKLANRGITSELVLVDTSNDETIRQILERYTDRIYPFQWCNDFAKARNVGVENARGEYFMFLDDDEWLVDMDAMVEVFVSGEYKNYEIINHKIRNFFDKKMESYSDAWVSRVMRLGEGKCFHSRVHEYFTMPEGPTLQVPSISYHTGYIFETEEEKIAHAKRNITLLEELIVEEPEEPRWKKQLCQEYWVQGDWEKELQFTKEQLPLVIKKNDRHNVEAIAALRICMIESYLSKKDYIKAEKIVLEGLCDKRHEQIAYAYFRIQYARICYHLGRYEEGIKNCKLYLKAYEVLAHHEAYMASQAGSIMANDAFDEFRYALAMATYIMCAFHKKDVSVFEKYYDGLGWDKKAIYMPANIIDELTDACANLEYHEIFTRAYTDLFRNRYIRNACFKSIYRFTDDKVKHDRILYALSKCDGTDWFIYYAKILFRAKEKVDATEMNQLLKGFFQDASNVLIPPEEIEEIMEQYAFTVYPYWAEVPFSKWIEHVEGFLEKANGQQKEELLQKMQTAPSADYRYEYYIASYTKGIEGLKDFYRQLYHPDVIQYYPSLLPAGVAFLYKEQTDGVSEEELASWKQEVDQIAERAGTAIDEITMSMEDLSLADMTAKFYEFAYAVIDYSNLLYAEEISEKHKDLLSLEARAAWSIWAAYDRSPASLELIVKDFLGAGLYDYELMDNCQRLAKKLLEYNRPTEELLQMAEAVKNNIVQMYEQGLYKEALESIQQLRQLLPFDKELIIWEKELHEG